MQMAYAILQLFGSKTNNLIGVLTYTQPSSIKPKEIKIYNPFWKGIYPTDSEMKLHLKNLGFTDVSTVKFTHVS